MVDSDVSFVLSLSLSLLSRENKTKFNLVWNEDESILRYDEGLYYYFDESKSSGDPRKINVTTINLPLIVSIVFLFRLKV